MTALHHACHNNFTSHIKLLLKRGADVTISDMHGRTPAHYAATHVRVAVLLLSLYMECFRNQNDFFLLNLTHRRFDTAFPLIIINVASFQPSHKAMSLLVRHNIHSIERVDESKRTPLHTACTYASIDTVKVSRRTNCRRVYFQGQ